MPKHIARLIVLFLGLATIAVGARFYLTDRSFYEYGHYRGNSVIEIARDKPKYQGTAYCASCHAAEFAVWSKGVHDSVDIGKAVKCEVCHGPGGGRDPQQGFINAATGPIHPDNLKLAIPTDTRALCTLCHEQITGRPLQQAQIVIADHAGTQQCTLCHNPHSPRSLIGSLAAPPRPGDAIAGRGKTATCAGCHGAAGVSASNLAGPTLAGQNQAYLVDALVAYKAGTRANPIMSAMVAPLGDGDIADIAAYYARQKCETAESAADRAAARVAGALMCTNCHGANGISGNRAWPNLAGQSKNYLADALKAYAGAKRTNVVMSSLAKSMSDADTDNLAAYYAGTRCE